MPEEEEKPKNTAERVLDLNGLVLDRNYIRPHDALKSDTPADRAGIRVEGENKWLTIIQNAAHQQKES